MCLQFSFGELQLTLISLNFKTSCSNLKIRGLGEKLCVAFLLYLLWKELRRFKVKESMFFNENEREPIMADPKQSVREMNEVLQLIQEFQIKSKTVMSWSWQKKKDCIFLTFTLPGRIFFNICALFQGIMYWVNFQNIYTFSLLYTIFFLVFNILESLQYILNRWQ